MKWHKEGVYTVGFAMVFDGGGEKEEENGSALMKRTGALSVAEKRIKQATNTHWIAVGGKDGKATLWDIY